MKIITFLLLTIWCGLSLAAAPCAPGEDSKEYFSMTVAFNLTDTKKDPFLVWECYSNAPFQNRSTTPKPSRHCLVDSWSNMDLRRLGDRADTVRLAADPKAAFRASLARHVKNQDDPRCAILLRAYP